MSEKLTLHYYLNKLIIDKIIKKAKATGVKILTNLLTLYLFPFFLYHLRDIIVPNTYMLQITKIKDNSFYKLLHVFIIHYIIILQGMIQKH